MKPLKYHFKIRLAHLLLACFVILAIGSTNIQNVSAEAVTIKIYTRGDPQTSFGSLLPGIKEPNQPKLELGGSLDLAVNSFCGLNNLGLTSDKSADCHFIVRHDPTCMALIKDTEKFTECTKAIAYNYFTGKEFSSFWYKGEEAALVGSKPKEELPELRDSPQKNVENTKSYTYSRDIKTDTSRILFTSNEVSLTGIYSGGYYKTYWEGCHKTLVTQNPEDRSFKNTIFCEPGPDNTMIKVYLEYPQEDFSHATLLLCQNPERKANPNKPAYDWKCTNDIVNNCFFNETPFDKCAYDQHPTSATTTTAITQPQFTELTTLYCRKFLLTSGDALSPFNNAYLACLKESQEECKTDTAGGIQAYGQCVKKIAYEKMAGVGLCLAGKNDEEAKTCSLRICKPNDKEVEQCKSAQGITKLESCTDRCPTGQVLCKGPALGATDSNPAPYLYCSKLPAGQRPAAPAGAARPAAGTNNAAAGKAGWCYSCQTTGAVTKWDKVGSTQMAPANCEETELNKNSNRSGIKYTGEPTWVDSTGENTGKPPEKPTSCRVTEVAKYDCYVCTKGQGNNTDNTWAKLQGDKSTKAQCEINTRTARSITAETDNVRNTDNNQKADYCPIKGNIGSTLSSGAKPPAGGGSIFGCKTTVNENSVTSNSAKAIPDFENTGNKVDGFDRVNWYLKKLPDGNYEFKGTNQNIKTETTFGAGSGANVLNPSTEYLLQAELYTQEGNDKREKLPCAPDNFTTKPPPTSGRQAMKFDANPTQAVLGATTDSYTIGFYVKAGSEDVTELNIDVKAYGGGGDASGAIGLENVTNGTARNGSVVRVIIGNPSQVDRLVVTTSYTFEGNLFPGASATMYLNRLDDSPPIPESQLQKTTLKPLDVQTITISPSRPTSTGFVSIIAKSTTPLGNWKIQVKNNEGGAITEGGNAEALTAGCENNAGGVCTYQTNFSQLPEGKYEAQLLSEDNVKASSEFSVVKDTLDLNGNPITPITPTTPAAPDGGAPSQIDLVPDEVKLSCSSGEFTIFQNGSPVTQTIIMNSDEDICRLTRYLNGSLLGSSNIKFKVGPREEPGAPGSGPDNNQPCEDNGFSYCEGGRLITKNGGTRDSDGQCQYNYDPSDCDGGMTCKDGEFSCSADESAPPACNPDDNWENQGYKWCNEGQKRKCTVEKNLCTGALRNEYDCDDQESVECGGSEDPPPCNEDASWENQGYKWCNEGQKRKCTVEKNLCTGALRNEYDCDDQESVECGGSSVDDDSGSAPNKCSPVDSTSDNGGGTFWYCDGEGNRDPRTYCWEPMWGNPDNNCELDQ